MRPTTDRILSQEAIRKTLAHRAGGASDASAIAEATVTIWQQVAVSLSPIIGAGGVDVLTGRAVHLTSGAFPCLADAGLQGDSATLLAGVKNRLAGSQSNIAEEASLALFTNFVELLTTLIGESLTARFLSTVWVPPLSTSEKETSL